MTEHTLFWDECVKRIEKSAQKWITLGAILAIITMIGTALIQWGVGTERDNEAERNIELLRATKVDRTEMEAKFNEVNIRTEDKFKQLDDKMELMIKFFGIPKQNVTPVKK